MSRKRRFTATVNVQFKGHIQLLIPCHNSPDAIDQTIKTLSDFAGLQLISTSSKDTRITGGVTGITGIEVVNIK